MRRFLLTLSLLFCTAVSAVLALPDPALAQNAITLPIAANAVADLGNGPIKVRMIAGNASIFTAQGSGTGSTSGSSTTLTLTATPSTAPLIGGLISGIGITSGTTVVAFNGTTGITLSAAMTVAGGTAVSWGAACPSSAAGIPAQYIQASAMSDYFMMYTQARVCAVSPGGPVNTLLVAPVFQDGAVVVNPGSANDLSVYNGAGTGLVDSGVNLTTTGQLYASPTGIDTNNNCSSSGAPCTLKGACIQRNKTATYLVTGIDINLSDGTYSATDSNNALCSILGDSGGNATTFTQIVGNCTNPTNVVLAIPVNFAGIYAKDLGISDVSCLMMTGGNGSLGIENSGQGAVIDYNKITWGAWGTSGVHISVSNGGYVNLGGDGETISGNFTSSFHIVTSGNANYFAGGQTNIPSAVSWSGGSWISAGNASGALINLTNWSTSGAGVAGSTGPQATFQGPGMLTTAGSASCTSVLPGSGGCIITQGFQTNAGDNPTSPVPAGGVTCPSGITAGTVTVVKGVVTHC